MAQPMLEPAWGPWASLVWGNSFFCSHFELDSRLFSEEYLFPAQSGCAGEEAWQYFVAFRCWKETIGTRGRSKRYRKQKGLQRKMNLNSGELDKNLSSVLAELKFKLWCSINVVPLVKLKCCSSGSFHVLQWHTTPLTNIWQLYWQWWLEKLAVPVTPFCKLSFLQNCTGSCGFPRKNKGICIKFYMLLVI